MSSFFDKLRGRAQHAVDQHGDKISQGLDKAAAAADKQTKGKYSDKIVKGRTKAQEALAKLNDKDGGPDGPTGSAGPTGPSGPTGPGHPPRP